MRKFFKWTFLLLLDVIIALTIVVWWYGRDDFRLGQQLSQESLNYPVIIQDRHGQEIHRIFGQENREWVALHHVTDTLKDATILAEDRRFYHHFGVDLYGIIRAVYENLKAGGYSQGASTLTQQIARKVFLTDQKSLYRKVREVYIALGIEFSHTKEEILEMYLNTVPYGPRTNGVKLAAQEYFNKNVSDLTDAEALILAVIPKDPVRLTRQKNIENWLGNCHKNFYKNLSESELLTTHCSPFSDPQYQNSRLEKLLFQVAKKQDWPEAKIKKIWHTLKKTRLPEIRKSWANTDYQHFQFFVRQFLSEKGIEQVNFSEGLIIKTSLDRELQNQIYTYMRSGPSQNLVTQHNMENFALLILDHQERSPLVWIGSKYFWNQQISGQVDMLESRRQTGSAIKPFIYYGAIENGYQPPTILYDSTVQFRGDSHWIRNADGHFLGGIRMSQALAQSRNITAAKAFVLAGGENIVKKLLDEQFGFDIEQYWGNHRFGWTMALGTAPVKIKDLANAYATLGSGNHQEICPILELKTLTGKILNNPCDNTKKPIDKTHAYFINEILSDQKNRPIEYQWRENITLKDFNLAVKTGTSSKRINKQLYPVDNFIAGYSPNNTILLWGGNTNGRGLTPGSVSISTIAPYWKVITQKFYQKYPEKYQSFSAPEDTTLVKIHGEIATENYRPPSYRPLFKALRRTQELGMNPLLSLGGESKNIVVTIDEETKEKIQEKIQQKTKQTPQKDLLPPQKKETTNPKPIDPNLFAPNPNAPLYSYPSTESGLLLPTETNLD